MNTRLRPLNRLEVLVHHHYAQYFPPDIKAGALVEERLMSLFSDIFSQFPIADLHSSSLLQAIFPDEIIRNEVKHKLSIYMFKNAKRILNCQLELAETYLYEVKLTSSESGETEVLHSFSNLENAQRYFSNKSTAIYEDYRRSDNSHILINSDLSKKHLHTFKEINKGKKETTTLELTTTRYGSKFGSNDVYEQFVLEFENMVKMTKWKTGLLGGESIEGVKGDVPKNIALAMEHCEVAKIDKNYEYHFHQIAKIGSKAHNAWRWDGFGLFTRCQEAKDIYSYLNNWYQELNKNTRFKSS